LLIQTASILVGQLVSLFVSRIVRHSNSQYSLYSRDNASTWTKPHSISDRCGRWSQYRQQSGCSQDPLWPWCSLHDAHSYMQYTLVSYGLQIYLLKH